MPNQPFAIFLSVLLCCILLFTVGCGDGRPKPKDMPPLYPCTLTFTQEGVPLEGARITLYSDSKWGTGGTTDDKGEVKLVTQGYYDGVPEGTYKITVHKLVVVMDAKNEVAIKQTDVVANEFKKEATTPLEITIGKKENDKTFDLGKAANVNVPVEGRAIAD